MKSFMPIGALLALLGSSSVFAANLNIPMAFEFLALDGQKVESSLFNHKSDLSLSQGVHKIAIRYSDMIEDEFSDSQSFVKSAPFILTLTVEAEQEYRLKPAGGDVIKRPKAFAKAPKVLISRGDEGKVDYRITLTDIEEESFVSRLFSGNKVQDIEAAAAAATDAAQGQHKPVLNAPVSQTHAAAAMAPKNAPQAAEAANQPQQMLQYWWLQADEKTRKEFMGWAIQQL
ncbi:DUF2057 domain-containing protein [Shewanella salipaludis]|uniref:DUF2057 domain-containing protein n=1 Tax=Shewanella salipaludis TaxID=2723052 RepID=A0A972FXF5_9GAMM|nr:DUF2057 domain-containing protein [Shewanella salipaludis]NMH64427.1 DUF2057 domain-containing protein [Shewanella salipaludis]